MKKSRKTKHRCPNGNSFARVKYFKEFTDMKDKFLVAAVDENRQIVFKTSMRKMSIASEMCTPRSILANEYCCFDGKVKRTAKFTTLTASVYHTLLQKQVPLATMECFGKQRLQLNSFGVSSTRHIARQMQLEINSNHMPGLPTWHQLILQA